LGELALKGREKPVEVHLLTSLDGGR
jgi:hypothetical protein